MIVAMGGDGTISEVVDGLLGAGAPVDSPPLLGVLHYGTGGDLCRSIGAPRRLSAAAAALRGERVKTIDVGRLSFVDHQGHPRQRHFVNVAGFGLAGMVDEMINSSSKLLGGRIGFASATIRAMRRYTPQRARLELDEGGPFEVKLQNVAIANGQYFGGGMHIAPEAQIDDGYFDVITIAPLKASELLRNGHRLYRGTHLRLPQVSSTRARRIEAHPVDPRDKILLDVDGETPGRLPAAFELIPSALRLKLPEPGIVRSAR